MEKQSFGYYNLVLHWNFEILLSLSFVLYASFQNDDEWKRPTEQMKSEKIAWKYNWGEWSIRCHDIVRCGFAARWISLYRNQLNGRGNGRHVTMLKCKRLNKNKTMVLNNKERGQRLSSFEKLAPFKMFRLHPMLTFAHTTLTYQIIHHKYTAAFHEDTNSYTQEKEREREMKVFVKIINSSSPWARGEGGFVSLRWVYFAPPPICFK